MAQPQTYLALAAGSSFLLTIWAIALIERPVTADDRAVVVGLSVATLVLILRGMAGGR